MKVYAKNENNERIVDNISKANKQRLQSVNGNRRERRRKKNIETCFMLIH